MALVVTINGTDRTDKVAKDSLKIENILTRKRDSCRFRVISHAGDTYYPSLGQEVIVTLDGTRVFGGIIVDREQKSSTYNLFDWAITCDDYTRLLDRKLIPDTYENMTVDAIIADIASNYMPAGFTVTNVNCSVNVKYIRFNYVPVSKALEQLAELVGYDYYIDYSKDIHFFKSDNNLAAIDIEDNNNSHYYDSLVIRTDNSQIRNSIVVRGGQYLGLSFTGESEADGTDYIFQLPYKFSEFRATLTGDPLSLGVDYLNDPNDYDALYNFNEKILRFKPEDTPTAGSVLRYSGLPYLPVIVRVSSQEAISTLSASEGGDGVSEYLIVDKSINSKEGARQRALAEIQVYATTISEGEFLTETTGLRAGQKIRINSASRGVDQYFIINKVTLTQFGTNSFIYEVSLISTKSFDFIDMMSRLLLSETKKIEIGEDETVDIVHSFTDSAAITDAIASTTSSEAPYKWSNDAGSTVNKLVWGFGTWS